MNKILLILIISLSVYSENIKVTFVNPGGVDDPFFSRLCKVMESAAKDLDISLEILYSGRDYLRGLEVGNTIFNREVQPDFLLLINENGMAERLVQKADSLGIKTVLFNEGFSEKYLAQIGNPVEVFENCIVELLPNDSLAGYLLATELIKCKRKVKPDGEISLLGITGSPRTTSSEKRTLGLKKAIADSPNTTLLQTAPAYWKKDKAALVTAQAFKRYTEIDIIWSASDQMADGVLDVIKKEDKNTITGGIDWATFAFDRVKSEDFSATVGGHFFDGAWALVLIYDYVKSGKLTKQHYLSNSFAVVNNEHYGSINSLLTKDEWDFIDFKRHTLFGNKNSNYDFSLSEILDIAND
jgi:ABC-type sugar transport system substrate-binding protein